MVARWCFFFFLVFFFFFFLVLERRSVVLLETPVPKRNAQEVASDSLAAGNGENKEAITS